MPLPILFDEELNDPVCQLTLWTVGDPDGLATVLAWLYLRKERHAARVIAALEPGPAAFPGEVFQNAIRVLSVEVADLSDALQSPDAAVRAKAEATRDTRTEHRDGLLFQHVSWVAAHLRYPNARSSPPHVRKADKGFDGVLVEVDPVNANLSRLVLCEDKASINPRPLVTGRIWPEIKSIQANGKDLEILAAVSAILDTIPDVDQEAVIQATNWVQARQFRVSLAAGADQAKDDGYKHLFGGFDAAAGGEITGRLAEVMPMPEVRAYLAGLADQVVHELVEMAANV